MTGTKTSEGNLTRVPLLSSAMVVCAGLVWSVGALAVRFASHADAWQYLIWRSIGIIVVVEVLGRRRGDRSMLRLAYTSGPFLALGSILLFAASAGWVYALKNTTAANAAFLASVTPLLAVGLARIVLGEYLTRVTVAAIALAFAGLAVMVTAEVGTSGMKGNVSALLSAAGFAGYAVCVRLQPTRDWRPALPGYASMMIVASVAVCLVNGKTLVPPAADITAALLHGGVVIVVGMLLFNAASRDTPAVAMTVLAQTETVFVPVWIFLFYGESPESTTLLGGAMILTAIIGKALLDARSGQPARQ